MQPIVYTEEIKYSCWKLYLLSNISKFTEEFGNHKYICTVMPTNRNIMRIVDVFSGLIRSTAESEIILDNCALHNCKWMWILIFTKLETIHHILLQVIQLSCCIPNKSYCILLLSINYISSFSPFPKWILLTEGNKETSIIFNSLILLPVYTVIFIYSRTAPV